MPCFATRRVRWGSCSDSRPFGTLISPAGGGLPPDPRATGPTLHCGPLLQVKGQGVLPMALPDVVAQVFKSFRDKLHTSQCGEWSIATREVRGTKVPQVVRTAAMRSAAARFAPSARCP